MCHKRIHRASSIYSYCCISYYYYCYYCTTSSAHINFRALYYTREQKILIIESRIYRKILTSEKRNGELKQKQSNTNTSFTHVYICICSIETNIRTRIYYMCSYMLAMPVYMCINEAYDMYKQIYSNTQYNICI